MHDDQTRPDHNHHPPYIYARVRSMTTSTPAQLSERRLWLALFAGGEVEQHWSKDCTVAIYYVDKITKFYRLRIFQKLSSPENGVDRIKIKVTVKSSRHHIGRSDDHHHHQVVCLSSGGCVVVFSLSPIRLNLSFHFQITRQNSILIH